ncbi:uncharacterized protein N0V89_006781 [Didymosphaeria variabile]|uniref:Argonaute linker 1 domain-containing protein n=1 Tax=Didymosphaeria variabile TaxID=1932322 RepID=A0A9W8XI03_9PLEO|nr:uncharacterized protein N0V89_006781 [Didymosphaeria variabile]KAJ4351439.1 hypothetical protein N0V89_006781 [Didymosphaeria variabile]
MLSLRVVPVVAGVYDAETKVIKAVIAMLLAGHAGEYFRIQTMPSVVTKLNSMSGIIRFHNLRTLSHMAHQDRADHQHRTPAAGLRIQTYRSGGTLRTEIKTTYHDQGYLEVELALTVEIPATSTTRTADHSLKIDSLVVGLPIVATALRKSMCQQDLHTRSIVRLTDYIAAANALVRRPIYDETDSNRGEGQGSLTQLGENRFFLNESLNQMTGLHAKQGYTTSIRPTKEAFLLNINTSSTAFFPDKAVSNILSIMKSESILSTELNNKDIERMMTGLKLRINYYRPKRTNEKGPPTDDINSEHSCRKVFKNLGLSITEQTFFDENNQARSVLDYFKERPDELKAMRAQYGFQLSSSICFLINQ